jgi:16S rRNA (uracil1498-N3)-methyltransferase
MHWFIAENINHDRALLSESESHHALNVLRLTLNTNVVVIDGLGNGWEAFITEKIGKQVACKLEHPLPKQQQPTLSVALAPTKQIDRTEWFVEKAVELGVDALYFFTSKNSERKRIRMDRLEKIAIAATKQSQRTHLPTLHGLLTLKDVLGVNKSHIIAWCGDEQRPSNHIKDVLHNIKNPLVIIGPEGDFTSTEIDDAISHGSRVVSLGDARLRTETAGIYVCAAHQFLTKL